jgi:GNAT superfamily N-acetyltransferase
MSGPDPSRLFDAVEATWPAARLIRQGPILLREGKGGGKRVSAATAEGTVDDAAIATAEEAIREMGQSPLFMVRSGEDALDATLDARGYAVVDPVVLLTASIAHLTDQPVPPVTAFCIWEPLAIMREIWAKGGIGPARIEVMERAACKTAVLARWNQRPAGTGFVAVDGPIAMVHAVEVLPEHRRQGVAGWIMRQAAFWAREQGAQTMAVLCTRANTGALRLYSGLGFEPVTGYHYRHKDRAGEKNNG